MARGPCQPSAKGEADVTVEQWVPPDVDCPSAWQKAQVEEYLCASVDTLSQDLSRFTGGHAVLGPISLSQRTYQEGDFGLKFAEGVWASHEVLAALVAAALGYDLLPQVDLNGAGESAVARVLGRCIEAWSAQVIGTPSRDADFLIEISCMCLGVCGSVWGLTAWSQLWRNASQWLATTASRMRLSLSLIRVPVLGLLRGPALRASEVMVMKVGDLIALPAGAERRVALTVHGLPVALGTLGALSERLAVRIEQVAGGTGRDGE